MALLECNFQSMELGVGTAMHVILPQPDMENYSEASGGGCGRYPVLYLLHGLSDDHTAWVRFTALERYARKYNLAVVMPAVHRSFYTDMAHGYKYWTFISEELPRIARGLFPISDAWEDNFVAGLSMGGYGAFKLAMRCPDRFSAAASFSGALDVAAIADRQEVVGLRELRHVFGDTDALRESSNDLFRLAADLAASNIPKPLFYQWCGTEDSLYEDNIHFRDHALGLGLDLHYEESPGGHNWDCWDKQIERIMNWLPLQERMPLSGCS